MQKRDAESAESASAEPAGAVRPAESETPPRVAELLALQRLAGNRAVARLLAGGRSPVEDVVSSGGEPLADDVRSDMEARLGHDFGDVRVHRDAAADESAKAVNASAYTVGSHLVFQGSTFEPQTQEGRRILAHELTHVVQQRGGPVAGTPAGGGLTVSDPSDRFEQEAERIADRAVTGPVAALEVHDLPEERRNTGVARSVVQRDDDKPKPATLDEALRTGDSSELEPFRPFVGINDPQLLSLVNLIVTQAFVSWREESILEEAWRSRGNSDSLQETDYAMWKTCVNRGADVKNVFWLRELRAQFATEVREEARANLAKNSQIIDAETQRLGINAGDGANPNADAAIKDLQEQAKRVKDGKDALSKLGQIDVGYNEPPRQGGSDDNDGLDGGTRPGGLNDNLSRARSPFSIDHKPQFPNEPGDGMPGWETIAAVHGQLTATVADLVNRNPALYAMVTVDTNNPQAPGGSDPLATPNQSPAEARAKIAPALKEVADNIAKTRTAIDDQSLGFEQMIPVQQKLMANHKVYSRPFAKAAAADFVKESGGDAAAGSTLMTMAAMALLLAVEIGTAGAASPAIGAIIMLTASGATAADSWNRWATLDTGARSTVSNSTAVVLPQQAEEAQLQALIDTAMALIDVYSVGAAVAKGSASALKVAGLEARLAEANKLANLRSLALPEQQALLTQVIEREGVQVALQRTGLTVDEMKAIVGPESAVGQRLAALAGGVTAKTAEDLTTALSRLAGSTAEEAISVVSKSIDVLGPGQTLQRAGGWAALDRAVGGNKEIIGRLDSWRAGLVDEVERSLADAAGNETAESVRGYLSQRSGIPDGLVEDMLGVAITMLDLGTEATASAEGAFASQTPNLDEAADTVAEDHGITVQRVPGSASPPLPLTERQLDLLSGPEFEELIRLAIGSGHFEADGLPRMSIMELKLNDLDHGIDGAGFRRRGQLVDLYKFEFKQSTGGQFGPKLGPTLSGTQGGFNWTSGNVQKLIASDDPVAMETLDLLRTRLRRYFGDRYSESLLLEAFSHELARAPLTVVTRLHAPLERLMPQLRGLARSLGKGKVRLLLVRGR
jgi:Domain of unknown function (DUF4157)